MAEVCRGQFMSVINKNHPFRETITHSSERESGSLLQEASSPAPPEAEASKKKGFLASMSPKSKVLLSLTVGGIICYGYVALYDTLYPQPDQIKRISVRDVADANRSVEDARRSAGFFGRLFCRGMQRSSFCR